MVQVGIPHPDAIKCNGWCREGVEHAVIFFTSDPVDPAGTVERAVRKADLYPGWEILGAWPAPEAQPPPSRPGTHGVIVRVVLAGT